MLRKVIPKPTPNSPYLVSTISLQRQRHASRTFQILVIHPPRSCRKAALCNEQATLEPLWTPKIIHRANLASKFSFYPHAACQIHQRRYHSFWNRIRHYFLWKTSSWRQTNRGFGKSTEFTAFMRPPLPCFLSSFRHADNYTAYLGTICPNSVCLLVVSNSWIVSLIPVVAGPESCSDSKLTKIDGGAKPSIPLNPSYPAANA